MITETEKTYVYKVETKSLDILSMGTFESELEYLLQNTNKHLFLDFSEVEEVSSAVLGILLQKKMKQKKLGKEIYLLNTSKSVQRILKILKLTSFLIQTKSEENFTGLTLSPI